MTKFSAIFCAQLAVSAVVLSISGPANAQDRTEPAGGYIQLADIACVDGMPAPPYTQICPPTTSSRTSSALAAVPRPRSHAKHKTAVQ